MHKKGVLHLFPCTIGGEIHQSLPPETIKELNQTRIFIVENLRSARRFLKSTNPEFPIGDCTFFLMDKFMHTSDIPTFLQPATKGQNIGVISEAGCPAVGDPGSAVVAYAHELGIPAKPHVGPSSFLLALMASGLNGQQFAFHGYLPVKDPQRSKKITELERESAQKSQAQIFMETPYRNTKLAEELLQKLQPQTLLSFAVMLTTAEEFIQTKTVIDWKKSELPDLHKKTTVFLLQVQKKKS